MAFLGFGKDKPTQQQIDAENARAAAEGVRLAEQAKAVGELNASLKKRTWADVYETQDKLDSGELASTPGVFNNSTSARKSILGVGIKTTVTNNPDTIGALTKNDYASSILGGTEAIAGYKKRKSEQKNLLTQGSGRTQSVLGGSVI